MSTAGSGHASIEHLRAFFRSGKTRPLAFRIAALNRLRALVEENTDDILDSVRQDLGKPRAEAYTGELVLVVNEINTALRYLRSWSRARRVRTPFIIQPGVSRIRPEPFGAALIISPWNYPFFLSLAPLVSAIAAGNCAVIKPSELCENASSCLARLIGKYFDPDYIAVQTGGPEASSRLISEKPDSLFFTGSSAVGKKVMAACAEHLIPLTLELGGKNPCIVNDCRSIQTAARRIAWGKFFNAGQTCFAPDYILVSTSLKGSLVSALKESLAAFYGAHPENSPDFARIISQAHGERLVRLAQGHPVLAGGSFKPDKKFISPTLLDVSDWQAPVMQEEIFGPLLPILEYTSLEAALDHISRAGDPLSAYLFSENPSVQEKVRNSIRSGSLVINTTFSHIMSGRLPFGGIGNSGMGQYRGRAGFDTFSHFRSEFKRGFLFDTSFVYPPYRTSVKILKRLLPFLF